MAGTTFPERLKPLFVYNFHRCADNNYKVMQVCGGVCGSGRAENGSDGWGRCEDATTNEVME